MNGKPRDAREPSQRSLLSEHDGVSERTTEASSLASNDPIQRLAHEARRASKEIAQSTDALRTAIGDAVARIERAASATEKPLAPGDAERIGTAIGVALLQDKNVTGALLHAFQRTEARVVSTIHAMQGAFERELRSRVPSPLRSLAFVFVLGVASTSFALWGAFHAGYVIGDGSGYQAGIHDAHVADARHRP